jgi:hypothetical protein
MSMDDDSIDDEFVQAAKAEERLLEAHNKEFDASVSSSVAVLLLLLTSITVAPVRGQGHWA